MVPDSGPHCRGNPQGDDFPWRNSLAGMSGRMWPISAFAVLTVVLRLSSGNVVRSRSRRYVVHNHVDRGLT